MSVRLFLLIVATLGYASSAQAQSRQIVIDQLDAAADVVAGDNFLVDGKAAGHDMNIGLLAANSRVLLEVWLEEGGEYFITGACDEDCGDLDLSLLSDTGSLLDEDIEVDAFPIVRVTAPSTGWFILNIQLVDCEADLCYFGYQVFKRVQKI